MKWIGEVSYDQGKNWEPIGHYKEFNSPEETFKYFFVQREYGRDRNCTYRLTPIPDPTPKPISVTWSQSPWKMEDQK